LSFSHNGFRAILFDLDGTLRHNRPSYAEAFFSIAARLGAPSRPEDYQREARWLHYYWARSEELVSDRSLFGENHEAFWTNHARLALLALGCAPEAAESLSPLAYQHMNEEYHPEDWVSPDVPPVLQALRDAGYCLAVLSNRSQPYQEQLEKLGLAHYFDYLFHAGEMPNWKPGSQVFLRSVQAMGIEPGEALYVGDSYYADVVGSSRSGMTPVLLDPENLFPEAECAVIRQIGDLTELLSQHKENIQLKLNPARS
jgi:HAD superfamily hydrolase (TIGR01549 family)